MKVISRFGLALCLAACALLTATVPAFGGQEDNTELYFARQLRKKGYKALAIDQLKRTRQREFLPPEVRLSSMKWLGLIYQEVGDAAAQAGDWEGKRRNYEDAIKAYDRFFGDARGQLNDEEVYTALFHKGELAAELGRDAAESMRETADEEERPQYREEALAYFKQATQALKKAEDFFVELRDQYDKGAETAQEKIALRDMRIKAGKVLMAHGKALYEFGRLYNSGEKPDPDAATGKFQAAIGVFESIAEHYSLFAIRYKAYRRIGLCYREMGSFEKAVEYLKQAVSVNEQPDTRWIIYLSRYNLAETYNDWGDKDMSKFEKADIAAQALVSMLDMRVAAKPGNKDLRDMYLAALLEKGKAWVGHAKLLLKKAEAAEKKNQQDLVNEYSSQAWSEFSWSVRKVKELAGMAESRWSRNAKEYLNDWQELSEELFGKKVTLTPDIHTYMAQGRDLFGEGQYMESILKFRLAVRHPSANPTVYSNLIAEAWYQMGVAYYNLSTPEHTGGNYTYYPEAGMCFDRVVERYSEAQFAADAAFYGQQLYGAIFDQTRQLVDNGKLPASARNYDGRRYYRALQRFTRQFPNDPRATDTRFQAAELARTLEQYEEASQIYAEVMQEHPRYYEAQFRGGICLYLEGLKTYEEALEQIRRERREKLEAELREKMEEATAGEIQEALEAKLDEMPEPELPEGVRNKLTKLIDGAVDRYQQYITWFNNNKERLDPESLLEVNKWVARTKVSYGKLLVHEIWTRTHDKKEGARQALAVLENVEEQHFKGPNREDLRANYLPEAFFVTIQAYRRLGELAEAEDFVDMLVERFGESKLSSQAAQLLGYEYLRRRRQLEKEGAAQHDITLAAQRAGHYLQKALELDPEQSLQVYLDTAAQLYRMEEYTEAIDILESGLDRFPIEMEQIRGGQEVGRAQILALALMEDAFLELEEWGEVAEYAEQLLELEEIDNERNNTQVRNIDYRVDYALAMEELDRWEKAVDYWREAKAIADKMEGEEGQAAKFRATIHLARSYAAQGGEKVDHGYRIVAYYLFSDVKWLQQKSRADQVEKLFDDYFRDKWSDLSDYVMNLVETNLSLLRNPESKKVITGLVERHWPGQLGNLQKLIEEAEVELRTE